MGKLTGFLEFNREAPATRPVRERINDYKEFVLPYPETVLNKQAARCMDCGVPFCHNGCPLGNLIPEFNDAVYRKSWKEAYEILSRTNNFPEFTGRLCPAPCESACVLGINKPAITIEEIEKHIIEIAFAKGFVKPNIPLRRSGKRVAVVGSGPAGLAAAVRLNYSGHLVTVFERDHMPGGLLRYGIPDFKLEKHIIDRRIRILEEEGVIFKCGMNVGVNIQIDELIQEFDAIVLAGGSTIPRDLSIPGRDARGVHFAMDFLKQQNKRLADENHIPEQITATGRNVIVIGGGDTGSDCVGTSNRQHAKTITQFELLPKPSTQRTPSMPWPSYPMLLKVTSSHEEGVTRHWAITTKEFLKDDAGHLRALKVADLEWQIAATGQNVFTEVPGSEREIPCDLALLAMGFVHPQHDGMVSQFAVELDQRGNVKTGDKSFHTSVSKIFSAGDMRRGQSLIVWALAEGRDCAAEVDEFLLTQK